MPISTPPAPAETALSGGEAQAREALGRSQGGFSTKLHLRAEGNGRPITAVLTGGERHEQIALEALLDQGAIRRPGRGRPRLRPRRVAGDKATRLIRREPDPVIGRIVSGWPTTFEAKRAREPGRPTPAPAAAPAGAG